MMQDIQEINFYDKNKDDEDYITYQFSNEMKQSNLNHFQKKCDFVQKVEIASRIYLKNLDQIIKSKSLKNIPIQQNFRNVIQNFNTSKIIKNQTRDKDFLREQTSTLNLSRKSGSISTKDEFQKVDSLASLLSSFWVHLIIHPNEFQNLDSFQLQGLETFLTIKFKQKINTQDDLSVLNKTFEQLKFTNKKRHEENYKFLAKRFLKFLKQTKSLNINFIVENMKIDFESYFPKEKFQDYFLVNSKKKQFIIKKANSQFFKIIFNHPVFYDYFFLFKQNLLQSCKNEAYSKFRKILLDFFKDQNFNQENIQKKFKLIINRKKLKLPWTYQEIEDSFNFVCDNFQFNLTKFYF